jgi:hypothetical protein
MNFTYNHVLAVQFLRTTYKAGPLLALALACLGGVGAARLAATRARLLGAFALAALAAVSCWPLVRGQALDSQLTWKAIPASWRAAAAHVDRTVGENGRAVVLPGQLYADYDWGGTVDAILPALAKRPVAVRYAVPYADLRAVDLLWTVDALVQQRRALPGQLGPLLDLLGARTVVAGADDRRSISGAVDAADAADVLDQLGRPAAAWGPLRPEPRAAGTLGVARALPRVRAWDRPSARPLVRVEGARGATVVDGSADGLAGLAALGALPASGRIAYAGDVTPAQLRAAAAGGEVVISDSNRRRVVAAARMAQNTGATLAADDPLSPDAAFVDPFPLAGSDGQTVARYDGVAYLRSPFSPAYSQFPERRPFAAFDGDPRTHWQADRALDEARHWLEAGFLAPRDVPSVDLLPYSDRRGRVTAVEVAGRRFAVHAGWNHLVLGLRGVRSLRVRIAGLVKPVGRVTAGAGGIRELRIPGLRVREALRPPVLAERALAGRDASTTGLTYLFQRTAGDDPFRRDPRRGTAGAELVRDRQDGERGLARIVSPPAARTWALDGWGSVAADAADSALDRAAGLRGSERFDSSGRFEGRAAFRASSAFDGTARPWIGSWLDGREAWLQWSVPRATTLRRLALGAPSELVRRPTLVRLRWGAEPAEAGAVAPSPGATGPIAVGPDGSVVLPAGVRGRAFRLEILRAAFPPGTPGRVRQRRAVGIGELSGAGVPRVSVPRTGRVRGGCTDLVGRLGTARVGLRVDAPLADLDAGRPLRLRGCGSVPLGAGSVRLDLPESAFAPYLVRMRSPAPSPPAAAASALPGRVLDPGTPGRDSWNGIRLQLREPAWLVLAESYSDAWRARCDGRDLGAPRPVDGFAMGWQVPASCRTADLAFAPDAMVRAGYLISAPVLLALVLLLLLRRRPRPKVTAIAPVPAGRALADLPEAVALPLPARRAALLAVAAGAVLGFMFAARGAPLIAAGVFVVLWRGIGVRALVAAAGGLLAVVVPVLSLAVAVPDRGGYNPEYAQDRIAAHWVAVAATILLMLALARALGAARRRRSRG